METHFTNGGGHLVGHNRRRGELPLKTNALAIAENALANLQFDKRRMIVAGVPIPKALLELEEVRKTILQIHQGRACPGMTRNCRGWRAHDLNTAMTKQMFLENKLGWLEPATPLPRCAK